MKLVIGLGNPGIRYEATRHNVGWMVVDALAKKSGTTFSLQKKFQAEIGEIDGGLLVKPQTFMNRSGEAVAKVMRFHKVPMDRLYVIHDDLDIPLGKYKIQLGRGPRQHNGLKSNYEELGTDDFWHVRIGIENRGEDLRLSGASHRARIAQDDIASLETLDAVSNARLKRVRVSGEEYVLQPFTGEEEKVIGGVAREVGEKLYQELLDSKVIR